MAPDGSGDGNGSAVDRRQLPLVGLAVLALVVAAFLAPVAPPVGGAPGSGEDPRDQPGGPTTRGDGGGPGGGSGPGDGSGDGTVDGDPLEPGDGDFGSRPGGGGDGDGGGGGDGLREVVTRRTATANGTDGDGGAVRCRLTIAPEPVPGATVFVDLDRPGRPVEGVRMWFNDRPLGRTDEEGRLRARVPYEAPLRLEIEYPDGEACGFDEAPWVERSGDDAAVAPPVRSAAAGGAVAPAKLGRGVGGRERGGGDGGFGTAAVADHPTVPTSVAGADPATGVATALARPPGASATDGGVSGETVTVPVSGTLNLTVDGRPFPGTTVALEAAIRGVPVRNGTVSVDGETVGRTDDAGRYQLAVPEDGTERLSIAVARGDYAASRTLRVLVLDARVEPRGLLLVPGGRASVVATRGGQRVSGASVTLDGRHRGATAADGALDLRLPLAVDGTVRVSTDRQSASADLAAAYRATALAVLAYSLLVGAASILVARRRGRRVGAWVAAGGTTLFAAALGHALGGWLGTALALVACALPLAAWGVARSPSVPTAESGTVGPWLAALPARVTALVLRVAGRLDGALHRGLGVLAWAGERLGRLAAWLSRQPGSVAAPLRGLLAPLRSLPGALAVRLVDLGGRLRSAALGLGRQLARLRALPWRAIVAVALAVGAVLALEVVVDWRAGLAAGIALAAGAVAWLRWRSDAGEDDDQTGATERSPTRVAAPEATDDGERPSLRERWRTFARWIRPRRWRVSAPAEVARRARDRGYPQPSVDALTSAFQALEYSEDQLSPSDRERAEAAFEALQSHRRGGEGVD